MMPPDPAPPDPAPDPAPVPDETGPFRFIEPEIYGRRDADLTAAWLRAKAEDAVAGNALGRIKLWEKVRSGVWAREQRARRSGIDPDDPFRRKITVSGRLLKVERVRAGYTLRDLATETGISRSTLSRMERGAARFDLERLSRIASALDVPLGAFIATDA